MAHTSQFCTLYLDKLLFGGELYGVQEVIRSLEMTKVPLAPEVVSGLINLRGQIVTAVDLRRRLELEPAPPDMQPMNVVVRSEDGAVSLLVDEIGDVVEVDESSFEPPPAPLQKLGPLDDRRSPQTERPADAYDGHRKGLSHDRGG